VTLLVSIVFAVEPAVAPFATTLVAGLAEVLNVGAPGVAGGNRASAESSWHGRNGHDREASRARIPMKIVRPRCGEHADADGVSARRVCGPVHRVNESLAMRELFWLVCLRCFPSLSSPSEKRRVARNLLVAEQQGSKDIA
jgi:hypothetical protein